MNSPRIEVPGLSLEVVARGSRAQEQSFEADFDLIEPASPTGLGELTELEAGDLAEFRRRWRFRPIDDIQEHQQDETTADPPGRDVLLARHPAGRLVVVEACILLKLNRRADIASLRKRYLKLEPLTFGKGLYEAYVRLAGASLEEALQKELEAAKETEGVVFAEPSILYRSDRQPREEKLAAPLSGMPHVFNLDVDRSQEAALGQWHWGQISLRPAWEAGNKSRGKGKRVGVIDLGFGPDDQMGKVAWAAVIDLQGEAERRSQADLPLNDHGVSCAALVAAPVDDIAVHGAVPEAELILVALDTGKIVGAKVLGKAITLCALGNPEWGVEGADVISCSLGLSDASWGSSKVVREAINAAAEQGRNGFGTLVVWAAFNRERRIPRFSIEAYRPLICVSVSDRNDELYESGYGNGLDLLAPGRSLSVLGWSAADGRRLASKTGSSLAAPCVAGVIALVLAANESLTAKQVAEIIQRNCDRSDGTDKWQERRGWGRLNALKAVTAAAALKPQKESDLAA